ncbi:MAG: hypothetical protein CTY15_03565 [Methylocystis sp.]|nr:MAG: hypothetical protein CTY15_03565 [Methylocystis sp.]
MFVRLSVAAAFGLALACAAPALARDRFSTDYGHNDNRHYQQNRRSGAWIGNRHGHSGHQWHGGHFGAHDHFSPRGQGGYHWGW